MERHFASLERVENDRKITPQLDASFFYRLQSGLLLALKEQGRLNEMQYRRAQDRLDWQRREWSAKRREKGGTL